MHSVKNTEKQPFVILCIRPTFHTSKHEHVFSCLAPIYLSIYTGCI